MTSNRKIPLHATFGNRRNYFRKYLIVGLTSIAVITAILYLYILVVEDSTPTFAMIPYYLIVPLFLLWDGKAKEKWFIQIEPEKILFKTSNWVSFHELHSNEISFIDINLTDVRISTKDLRAFKIEIGYAKHSDMMIIKQKLQDFKQNAMV